MSSYTCGRLAEWVYFLNTKPHGVLLWSGKLIKGGLIYFVWNLKVKLKCGKVIPKVLQDTTIFFWNLKVKLKCGKVIPKVLQDTTKVGYDTVYWNAQEQLNLCWKWVHKHIFRVDVMER